MAWEYKVVTILGKRSNQETEQQLNELGQMGWEIICPVGPFYTAMEPTRAYLGRPSVDVVLKRQSQEVRYTFKPRAT